MHIRFIRTADTYSLRLRVLRPGGVVEDCHWPNDRLEGSFHLGVYLAERIICIGSFYPEKHPDLKGWKQFRLRGMATDPDSQGQGAGTQLMRFALDHLKGQRVDLVWCNARLVAVPFYRSLGFQIAGEEFDIPGIGPHYMMWRRL